jgi:peptidoglycan hydrolase CwlO-like protein
MKKETPKSTAKTSPKRVTSHTTDDLKRYLGSLSEDFQHKVAAIGEQFGGLNKKLDMHTEMIGAMQEDLTVMKSDIEIIKADLKKKVDYDEFHALARRVANLEQKSRR